MPLTAIPPPRRIRKPKQPTPTGVYFTVPHAFCINHHSPDLPTIQSHLDDAHYLLNLLWEALTTHEEHGGWRPLSQKKLRRFINHRHLKPLLIELEKTGWIQTTKGYQANVQSKGYRLSPQYWGEVPIEIECQNKRLANKIIKDRVRVKGMSISPSELPSPHNHLYRCLPEWDLDEQEAIQTILQTKRLIHPHRHIIAVKKIGRHKRLKDVIPYIVDEQGRAYNPIASLPKEVRALLKVRGKRVVCLDIRNSQPLFLALWIKQLREQLKHPPSPLHMLLHLEQSSPPPSPLHMLLHFEQCKDVDLFIALTTAGTLYDYLAKLSPRKASRDTAKNVVIQRVLYGEPKDKAPQGIAKLFSNLFPTVYRFIMDQKANDYTELPKLLMKRESDLIMGGVCSRLGKEFPAVPILTIHDAILTIPEHEQTVRGIIEDEFHRQYGVKPPLKTSHA